MTGATSSRLTRADWLALGERLLCAEGPDALGIDRLTAAAGRTKGSFYHHFQSRDDFLEALLQHWRSTTVEAANAPYRAHPSHEAWRILLHDAPFALNHPFERALRRLAVGEPAVGEAIERVDKQRLDSLTFLVSQLRPELSDPRAFALLMYAAIVGCQWLLRSTDDPRVPALRAAVEAAFSLTPDA